MRRSPALLAALALLSCARDLTLPDAAPPRVDAIRLVGLEGVAAPDPLPVLGGELLAVRGGGYPTDPAQLEVRIGGEDAEVLDAAPDRLVVRVPTLASSGPADLQVRTPVGFRTAASALRYDGPGQPLGLGTSDLPTTVPIGFVAPVQPPDASGFSDLAVAIGASDSALVVLPALGVAATTVPLGLVPVSAAARLSEVTPGGDLRLEVLAVARGGEAALGSAILSRSGAIQSRVAVRPLSHASVNPTPCSVPQVLYTTLGRPVAAWIGGTPAAQRIATIDQAQVDGGQYAPANGIVHVLAEPIVAWAPWKGDSVLLAAGSELYEYDAAAQTAPARLLVTPALGPAVPVTDLLLAGCSYQASGIEAITTLAAASSGGSDALAVSYRAGGLDRIALVDLTAGPGAGRVRRGFAGTAATSLALVPEPPFGTPPEWAVLAAGLSRLYRLRPLAAGGTCPDDLVPDAALDLTGSLAALPTFGGMATTASGTRLLSRTPDGDLVTILPPTLTSAGPVLRVASYGGLSMQVASLGGEIVPVAVAEHARTEGELSALDTGSALLAISLSGSRGAVALGGSGYGRGAVWLEPPAGGALAYTGDLPATPSDSTSLRGGAAAVTGFAPGVCPGEEVRVTGSRGVENGPDLVAQGPARAGAFGPEGLARYGPAAPPVYAVAGKSLGVYPPDPGNLACLAGAGNLDWNPLGPCAPDSTVDLVEAPLDVTLGAGDRAVAARSLDADACTPSPGFLNSCPTGDLLCQRASCLPAPRLVVVRPPAPAVTVALPARPASVAADRGGGFLVTLPCALSTAAGGDDCFPADALCDGFLTGPGGADGALLLVAEDGSRVDCLAVLPALAGPISVTPNGAEAWVTGTAFGLQILSRLALPRSTADGTLDPGRRASRLSVEGLGGAAKASGSFPAGGVAFTPDGATGVVTVPGEFRMVLVE